MRAAVEAHAAATAEERNYNELAAALKEAETRRRSAAQHALNVMADNLSATQEAVLKVRASPPLPAGKQPQQPCYRASRWRHW
jgi:hypothetical protein